MLNSFSLILTSFTLVMAMLMATAMARDMAMVRATVMAKAMATAMAVPTMRNNHRVFRPLLRI